jgi:F420-dependent oxidoreductase-like protein
MRIGLFLAYWPWFSPEEQLELATLADELGLDSVWISEAWGQDAVSVLGLLAGRTERVGLGSGVMQIPARQPTAAAMAAVTLDVLSGGRFRLGLGVSGPQVSEGWYGVPFRHPVRRTREYVEIVRRVVDREGPLRFEGREWRLPLAPDDGGAGLGKPLKLLASPVQERIPIYLGAIGPRSVEQVGEIADGWLPFLLNPREPEVLFDPLRTGARRAGRSLEDIEWHRWSRWPSTTTWARRATPPAPGWRSTWAPWGRGRRTSMSIWPSATATARRHAPARRGCWRATAPGPPRP